MILECKDGSFAVVDVALVIAVGELRPDITQVALLDRLTAQRAERLRAGCSAVHQDESHGAVPRILRSVVHFHLLWALRGSWLVSVPCSQPWSWFSTCEADSR